MRGNGKEDVRQRSEKRRRGEGQINKGGRNHDTNYFDVNKLGGGGGGGE